MFQLHIISPIFLVPFLKSFKFGLIFNTIAILVFSFIKIIPKLFFGLNVIPFEISKFNSIKDIKHSMSRTLLFADQYIYIFIVGIVFGYFLRKRTKYFRQLASTKYWKYLLSIVFYSLCFSSVIWSENFKDINIEQNQLNFISWLILANIFWSFGIIWTIILFVEEGKGE